MRCTLISLAVKYKRSSSLVAIQFLFTILVSEAYNNWLKHEHKIVESISCYVYIYIYIYIF